MVGVVRTVPDCEHDTHVYACRSCRARYGREDYQVNKDRYYTAAKNRKVDLQAKVDAAKSVPCTGCGGTFDPICMDFDHLPGFTKVTDICSMMRRRMAWSKIEAEMRKCEVVCANCHRLRTKKRGMNA